MHFSRLFLAPTEDGMMSSEWKCRRSFKNMFFDYRGVSSLLISLFLAHSNVLFAQQFGGNPPSIRWMHIDTDTVRVIFPAGMQAQANRVANTVHHLSKFNRRSIGDRNAKVSITLQNQTTLSNGYVGLAPFRSEFFTTPPQSPYFVGGNWLDLLSIHEYRHVLQFVNGRVGITNLVYYLTGELGWSTLNSIAIPDWFWEGDAIVCETALTSQGRGRMPEFYNGFRALEFSGTRYNYQKVRNGSLRNFVPDHYQSGYLLCRYGREQYGNDFWKPVLRDAGRFRSLFYPFAASVKRYSGLSMGGFYQKAFSEYCAQWAKIPHDEKHIKTLRLPDRRDNFTGYRFPQYMSDSTIIAYKASYRTIGGFYVLYPDGRDERIVSQGLTFDSYFSYRNGMIAWAEIGFHERWGWRDYSNIILYDIHSGRRRKLTQRSRYFSPDISHDGQRIVVFTSSPDLRNALHILGADDGVLHKELPNPDNLYFSYPKWGPDDRDIYAIARIADGKNSIVRISTETGAITSLMPFTDRQIGILYPGEEFLYFSAAFSEVDNLCALRLSDNRIYRLSQRRLGAYEPVLHPHGDRLAYSEFAVDGQSILELKLDIETWEEVAFDHIAGAGIMESPYVEMEGGDITSKIANLPYPERPFSQLTGLVNVHSWGLYFNDPEYELAVQSDNVLNTLSIGLGGRYNRNQDNITWFFNALYGQLYPLIRFETAFRPRDQVIAGNVVDESGNVVDQVNLKQSWWEMELRPGLVFPFNLSSGTYIRSLSPFAGYTFTRQFNNQLEQISGPEVDLSGIQLSSVNRHSLETGFTFANRRLRARQNIFPAWSQFVLLRIRQSVDGENVYQTFADSEWTFPSFARNHNSVVQASWQRENPIAQYRFVDNFFYSRGYNRPFYVDPEGNLFFYSDIYKLGFNYHFPLIYPDLGVFGILYFYRLRVNGFFDHSQAFYASAREMYNSAGSELIFDTRIMNTYSMSFGLRFSYLFNVNPINPDQSALFEFFIPLMRF